MTKRNRDSDLVLGVLDKANELVRYLVRVSGNNEEVGECFCYVLVSPADYIILKRVDFLIDISDVGEVIVCGKGGDLTDFQKEIFYKDYALEENFAKDVNEEAKNFFEEIKKLKLDSNA